MSFRLSGSRNPPYGAPGEISQRRAPDAVQLDRICLRLLAHCAERLLVVGAARHGTAVVSADRLAGFLQLLGLAVHAAVDWLDNPQLDRGRYLLQVGPPPRIGRSHRGKPGLPRLLQV